VDEGMVEDINNMLNSGEVPSLFTPEEKDKKINQSMERAREANMAASRDEVYSYFIGQVRDNLHIVLGMSPVGDAFRTRCRNFPSLTNCCTIDWFDKWPDDALLQVAQDQFTCGDDAPDFSVFEADIDLTKALTEMCVEIHSSVSDFAERFFEELRRRYYVTPTSYLEFIRLYITLLTERHKEVNEQLHRLSVGSEKMVETNEFIDVKQKEVAAQKPILIENAEKNSVLLEEVERRTEKAEHVRVSVGKQQEEASEQQKVAAALKEDAERELGEAMPALNKALKALENLDKQAINEIKSYKQPPEAVEMTMEAVMILLMEGKFEWRKAKDLLSRSDFMQRLLDYNKEGDGKQKEKKVAVQKVMRFIKDDKFTPEEIEKGGSSATKVLCIWCHATVKFAHMSEIVAPKKAALEAAEADLAVTNGKLKEAKDALNAVEEELAELQRNYHNSIAEKQRLEENIKKSEVQLANAAMLTESLGSESERWKVQIGELKAQIKLVPGDVFLASASICYFGAFTPVFRKIVVASWLQGVDDRQIPRSEGYSLVKTCATPMQVQEWQIYSLPTDDTSSENAVLCDVSCDGNKLRRWPLMIDPQGQATKWIKSEQASRGLKICKMTQPRYLMEMEQAIRNGLPVLLHDVGEHLDPALEPVLQKQVYQDGGRYMINLGGETAIEYHQDFRLYMTTKIANPHYLPEICIKVTLINFTVTSEGLEDQMLGDVVSIERQELEEEKSEVIRSVASAEKKKKKYQNQILERLESATGNILDNLELIVALQKSSSNTLLLVKQLEAAAEKERGINEAREVFRPVANRAAVLYFVIADLPLIAPMYQYSLDYFKRVVKSVIQGAPKHDKMDEHLDFLRDSVTETCYKAVCRGLFNADKTVFSVLMCSAILRGQKVISDEEWTFFNRASALVRSDLPPRPESLEWMPMGTWGLLDACERCVPELKGIMHDVVSYSDKWESWYYLNEPQEEPFPGKEGEGVDWQTKLTSFQKCVVMRVFREEKLLYQLMNLCRDELGKEFIEPPPFDMEVALADSAFDRPVIFILSQGSDPTEAFFKWAKEKKGKVPRSISMGQGQEQPAKDMIAQGKIAGDWVLLQNCHLGRTFMNSDLSEIVASLDPKDCDKTAKPDFRFWMTSMPVSYFPTLILQNSIKLTNEAPSGIRANMRRCYGELRDADVVTFDDVGKYPDFPDGNARSHCFKKLLWGLHFFHAIILERRKFGPLGWNNRYEWNDTDLNVSRLWLKLFLEQEEVPWESMVYIIGQINYGGRVTDPLDRLCMMSILKTFFSPAILDDEYVFSASGVYHAPIEGDLRYYLSKIDQLPSIDEPEVFGMHENASLRFQLQESQLMLHTLLAIQPRATAKKGGQSPEEQAKEKAIEMEAVLPEVMNLEEEAGPKSITFLPGGVPNSLSTVLTHEVGKFNKLIRQQMKTLSSLKKALAGETLLSDELDQMFTDFLNDNVPQLWAKVAYLSLKPLGSWMKDMVARVAHCRQWLRKGQPPSFWISGLFSPHGFMTGVLQAHAREYIIPVDVLGFAFNILAEEVEDVAEGPESGVYVHGLISDSWRWDKERGVMEDSMPGRSYDDLPVIHFLPEKNHETPVEKFRCPCYITTSRKGTLSSLGASTNFILCIEANTDKEGGSDYWIRKGAVMVCQLPT